MHLGRPLAQQGGHFKVDPSDQLLHQDGHLLIRHPQRRDGRVGRDGDIGGLGQDPLDVTGHLVQGESPGIALVRNQLLQKPGYHRLGPAPPVFDGPGERRDVGIRQLFGEESADFGVGVDSFVETAVKLQVQGVGIDHGRIALLRLQNLGGGQIHAALDQLSQNLARVGRDLALLPLGALAPGDHRQQIPAKGIAADRVIQDARQFPDLQMSDDRAGKLGRKLGGLFAFGEGERQLVGFGQPLRKLHLDETQQRGPLVLSDRDDFRKLDLLNHPRLSPEPAAAFHVVRKDPLFQG